MKKAPHQLRLDPDVDEEVKKIAAATNLSQIEIMRQMVIAGVRVIKANGYKLTLPLKLELAKEEEPKNLSSSTSASHRQAEGEPHERKRRAG